MDLLDLFTILCILIPGAYCAVIDINFGLRRKLSVRELFINIALFNFAIANDVVGNLLVILYRLFIL